MKRLGIKVTLTKHGRYGYVDYAVYQHDALMLKLKEEKDVVEVSSYSPNVTLRLHSQKQIEDYQLEANIPWGKEAFLSTRNADKLQDDEAREKVAS